MSPEPASNQVEQRGDLPSASERQCEDDALQTPDRDALPELAEKQKFCFSGEEGEKSMIGNFVTSKLGAHKC